MKSFQFSASLTLALLGSSAVLAFHPSNLSFAATRSCAKMGTVRQVGALEASRRSFVENLAVSTIAAVVGTSLLSIESASASGGATAGGVYLLSAKQRYNNRVSIGVKGFLAIGPALESGDIDPVRAFFTSEDAGNWKDFAAAGYLLANAFRRNSSAPPDTLPSVKKWKAYAAQVEALTKALKKKDRDGALAAYEGATAALDEYLGLVELPSAKEISSS